MENICLVTGGAGFIGSHLVELLLNHGYKVVSIDNFSTGVKKNADLFKNNKNYSFFEIDITKKNQLKKLTGYKFKYIFHLAGLADIVPSIEKPNQYIDANVLGTLNVLELSRNTGIAKFLYAASSSCYGIPKKYPTTENEDISPQYPYALSKQIGESLVMHWNKVYKIPSISLRLFNVYGPRSRTSGAYGAVFGVFLAQKINNKPLTIVGDGEQSRDFTFVTDVAEAFYKSAISDIQGEIFNVGSGDHYKINLIANLLGGKKIFIPKRPGEPDKTYADISKIQKSINWQPRIKINTGIQIMLSHLDDWRDAPVWDKDKIETATKTWFDYLS